MGCIQSGVCCKLFVINLNKEGYESGQFETVFKDYNLTFKEAEPIGGNFLAQNEDESCIYLKEGKCSIHQSRPKVCREFFCDTKDKWYDHMVKIVNEYKEKQGIPINR